MRVLSRLRGSLSQRTLPADRAIRCAHVAGRVPGAPALRELSPAPCHPRDLMQHLGAASRFLLKPAELTPELVELACETYFVPI